MRKRWLILLVLLVAGLILVAKGYANATADPIVRRATVALPGYPADADPLTLLVISDIHVAGPDMPPERLERIVAQINALKPDIVMLAGDFVSDKALSTRRYSFTEALAPLKKLNPRFGTYAVLGNHEHYRDATAARAAIGNTGITLLNNSAVQAGPIALGGADDINTGHARLGAVMRALGKLKGARVLLSHSPDPAGVISQDLPLVLAGHTHCGQISLPWYGPVTHFSYFGARYGCGFIREEKGTLLGKVNLGMTRTTIVGAGVGTSKLPLRYRVPPDMWLVRVGRAKGAPVTPAARPSAARTTAPRNPAP